MQPVITQRHVGLPPQYIQSQNVVYQPTIAPNVAVRSLPAQQPNYIHSLPIHVPTHIPRQPIYSQPMQEVPIQGYVPQYQPLYVQSPPIAQQISPYFTQYIQPVPVNSYRNVHPQMELNHNFDYEAANFLTDTTIVQNTVYCVICGHNFKASQKDQHLKKHMRKTDNSSVLFDLPTKSVIENKVGNKKQYIIKPLVQPEEHTIQYQPLVYEIVQEVLYQDKAPPPMKDEAIGLSFDQNVSYDLRNSQNSLKGVEHVMGNTLNVPVQNLQNSKYQQNGKINQSFLSELNKSLNPSVNNQNNVSQGSQAENILLKKSEPKKT